MQAKLEAFSEKVSPPMTEVQIKIMEKHAQIGKNLRERKKILEDNQKAILQIRIFKDTLDLHTN